MTLTEEGIDMNRELIKNSIQARKINNEVPTPCVFQITTPRLMSEEERLETNEHIAKVISLLEKYGIEWREVDTIEGAFNLNREWIESSDIPCYIEYTGVYPTDWDVDDIATLAEMDARGDIMISVLWHTSPDKYIPNH